MTKILVVEDDRTLSETLAFNFRREQYTPVIAADASEAVVSARRERPDAIILDLMLPGGSGFDVCKRIREFSKAPIIMLTARGDDVDRVLGLEVGADDYVTKPFNFRELVARVRANLRRVEMDMATEPVDTVSFGPIEIDVRSRAVTVTHQPLSLQPKEFDLLHFFVAHPGVALRRERLLAEVWGHDFVGPRTVDVHVRRLRSKLAEHGADDLIGTIHSVGYIFGRAESEQITPTAASSEISRGARSEHNESSVVP